MYLLPLPASKVYIWDTGTMLTLVETGIPGSAGAILDAVAAIGHTPSGVERTADGHIAYILANSA